MDSELRTLVNREVTKITNELAPLRAGRYHTEEQALAILWKVRGMLWPVIMSCEYPQLSLWKENDGRN